MTTTPPMPTNPPTHYNPPKLRPYTPDPQLNGQLAALGYECVRTFTDQRPITPGLVMSRLTAHGDAEPTLLATIDTADGTLAAAAALRHPTAGGGTSRLWGPLVRPGHQRHGLGRRLLETLSPRLHAVDGTVLTAEIPDDRPAAAAFFAAHNWRLDHSATLLKAPLPLTNSPEAGAALPAGSTPIPGGGTVRAIRPDELAHERLAALYAAARPHDKPAAAGALDRWRADERFHAPCLTLAEHGPWLIAAALVYPLTHTRPSQEPSEALLGDLLIHPDALDGPDLAARCAHQALSTAADQGAHCARSIISDQEPVVQALLEQLGFTTHAQIRHYRHPDH